MSELMRSVYFEQFGEPGEVLRTREEPVPVPGRGEVLVRMIAAPVNPSDLMFVRGTYGIRPNLPARPGFEGTGIVVRSGGGLRGQLYRNKRVAVVSRSGGTWSEYCVVPDDQVMPTGSQLPNDQAACFFVNPATAWIMTQEVLGIRRGRWLLQTAAASGVGRMIIRLGRHCGFRTVNIVRREDQVAALKADGADRVIVFDSGTAPPEGLPDLVRRETAEDGVPFAVDPVGGPLGSVLPQCLANGGRMLAFGTLSDEPLSFSGRVLMTRGASLEGFWLGRFMADRGLPFKIRLIFRLRKLISAGILATEFGPRFAPANITDAVAAAETPGGKVLLVHEAVDGR